MTRTKHPKRWFGGPIVVIVAAGALMTGAALTSAATAATASTRHVARPAAGTRPTLPNGPSAVVTSNPVTAQHQEFNFNTNGFCNNNPVGAPNPPCDGAPGDFGTIDRVPSGFSNGGYGNYAPSTQALFGGYFALTSGSEASNQGVGCTIAGTEACSGPYALFGSGAATGAENTFPQKGFTVTNDLYLSPTTAPPAGNLVDDDVEINNSSGGFGIDNVITACPAAGGFTINFGNGSPGSCAGSPVITTDGWYRFVFVFSNVAGYAYVTESVLSEPTLTQMATSGPLAVGAGAPTLASTWGGPGYFWLPTENISGLPLANLAVQLGDHVTGYTS
jgi:hypothetical protein